MLEEYMDAASNVAWLLAVQHSYLCLIGIVSLLEI